MLPALMHTIESTWARARCAAIYLTLSEPCQISPGFKFESRVALGCINLKSRATVLKEVPPALDSWCSLLREDGGLPDFITLIQVVKQTLSLLAGKTLCRHEPPSALVASLLA